MPKVNVKILIIIAGILWTTAGLMLIYIAVSRWYFNLPKLYFIITPIIGLLIGFVKAKLVLNKFADKNISRIKQYQKKVCAFAFQTWESYFLVIFMMGLGFFLRTCTLIPVSLLTIIYFGIGLTLIFASLRYYKSLSNV